MVLHEGQVRANTRDREHISCNSNLDLRTAYLRTRRATHRQKRAGRLGSRDTAHLLVGLVDFTTTDLTTRGEWDGMRRIVFDGGQDVEYDRHLGSERGGRGYVVRSRGIRGFVDL